MLQNRNFIKKSILTLIGIMFVSLAFAQDWETAKMSPKANEQVIGNVTENSLGPVDRLSWNEGVIYKYLFTKAKKEYPNKNIELRNFIYGWSQRYLGYKDRDGRLIASDYLALSAKVVVNPEQEKSETFVKVVDKALSNVREGSRIAIDQVSVSGGADRRKISDQLTDILLEKGYKVVAKSFLEQVQEEHIRQQSGGFNERTTAKTNNLSGIGYFLNVRVDEKSIRIQVINVSTGEFEGNVTVDF